MYLNSDHLTNWASLNPVNACSDLPEPVVNHLQIIDRLVIKCENACIKDRVSYKVYKCKMGK